VSAAARPDAVNGREMVNRVSEKQKTPVFTNRSLVILLIHDGDDGEENPAGIPHPPAAYHALGPQRRQPVRVIIIE